MAAYLPLLLQPREVEAFAGLPVASLAAAKSHSAGVLASGEVLTWGEGSDGKLGLGGTGGCSLCLVVEGGMGARHGRGCWTVLQVVLQQLPMLPAALCPIWQPLHQPVNHWRRSTCPQTARTRPSACNRWRGGCTSRRRPWAGSTRSS